MYVVLTFDDGPVRADIADPVAKASEKQVLLGPLEQILSGLERQRARGVFYIKGPGGAENESVLKDAFGQGIASIHQAGQIMGYHAYNHGASMWAIPENLSAVSQPLMVEDLRQLKAYVDEAGVSAGLSAEEILSPVFRQPFGGSVIGRRNGWETAWDLGLTYHAYLIDSFDWTVNADCDPSIKAKLPVDTEADHLAFVRSHLREKAQDLSYCSVVDVLFHVNQFTADHLDEFVEELRSSFEQSTGKTVIFDVPPSYLTQMDTREDGSVLFFLL